MDKYKLLRSAVPIKNFTAFLQNLGNTGISVDFRKGKCTSADYAKKYVEYADKYLLPWDK